MVHFKLVCELVIYLFIQDIRLYVEHFHGINFSHVCRNGNSLTHNLTRHAYHVTGSLVWIEDVLPQVSPFYLTDLASVS